MCLRRFDDNSYTRMQFLTFSSDTLAVHLQVDLDEFGVADFVPTSRPTTFKLYAVCVLLYNITRWLLFAHFADFNFPSPFFIVQ